MPFAMTLACFGMGLTFEEALVGATINAAYALDRHDRIGSLEPGKQMDAVVVDGPAIDLIRVGARHDPGGRQERPGRRRAEVTEETGTERTERTVSPQRRYGANGDEQRSATFDGRRAATLRRSDRIDASRILALPRHAVESLLRSTSVSLWYAVRPVLSVV